MSSCPSTISSCAACHHPQATVTPPWEQPRRELVPMSAQPCMEEEGNTHGSSLSPGTASFCGHHSTSRTWESAFSAPPGSSLGPSQGFWKPSESSRSTEPPNRGNDSPGRSLQDQPLSLSAQPLEKGQQRHGWVGTEHCCVQTESIWFLLLPSWLCHKGLVHAPLLPVAGWILGFTSHLCLAPADPC